MDSSALSDNSRHTSWQLTFLGTGTSVGVPVIGCSCDVCRSTDAADSRLRTSALLRTPQANLLIDCGPDFRQQILAAGSPPLHALILTHHHYDHISGLDDLRPYCTSPQGFNIYASPKVCNIIRRTLSYCFGPDRYPGSPRINLHPVTPYQPFTIGSLTILPLTVMHSPSLPILAYRIGPLGYVTDCKTMPAPTLEALSGVSTLVINALRQKHHPSHMNLSEALDVITAVNPSKAWLTHMSHDIGRHDALLASLPPHVAPAFDHLTIDI